MQTQPDINRMQPDIKMAKQGFRIHFGAYILVNLILIAINLLFTPETYWFQWPLMGWGIGIFAHGLATYSAIRKRPKTRPTSSTET